MPGAMRNSDPSIGVIEAFYPSPAAAGSQNVRVNGKLAMRIGDAYEDHMHLPPIGTVHTGRAAETGSSTVRINRAFAHREQDLISGGRYYTIIREEVDELCGQNRPGFIGFTPGGGCFVSQNGSISVDEDCCTTRTQTFEDLYFEPCNDIAALGSQNVIIGGSMTPPSQGSNAELISSTLINTTYVG